MGKQAMRSMQLSGLAMVCLINVACNQENAENPPPDSEACELAIRKMIELEFSAPDREMTRIKQEIHNRIAEDMAGVEGLVEHPGFLIGDPELEEYYGYATETYTSYFTESAFDEFVESEVPQAFSFHQHNLDYRLKPINVSVEKVEIEDVDERISVFNLDTNLNYQTRFEEGVYNIRGWALCTPEGKISHLTIIDQDELAKKMTEDRSN